MEADPATDLIEEYINESVKPDEPAKFIFPLTETEFSDTLTQLATMARKSKITYEVITNADDKKRRPFQEVVNGAAHTHLVSDTWTQMQEILTEAPKAALFVLWDDKRDDELQEICGAFLDAEITVLDLTNGLARLEAPGDEGEEGEEAEETEEEEQAQEEEAPELEDEATTVYTRLQLEKMPHAEVKEIAVGMNLAPRKARENMILAILEAQGTAEASVGPVEAVVVTAAPVDTGVTTALLTGLEEILDKFGSRFFTGLDDWLTKFSTAAEGFAFNTAPEEPMEVEPEPETTSRRRLVRR